MDESRIRLMEEKNYISMESCQAQKSPKNVITKTNTEINPNYVNKVSTRRKSTTIISEQKNVVVLRYKFKSTPQ